MLLLTSTSTHLKITLCIRDGALTNPNTLVATLQAVITLALSSNSSGITRYPHHHKQVHGMVHQKKER